MTVVFQAADLTAQAVPDAETETVQPLLERCEEFYQLTYGRPALPDQARKFPEGRPPKLTPGQGHLFALKTADGGLVGVIEALRDFPAPGEWFLGLLLLAPEARGQGRGEAVVRAYETHLRANGGRLLRLVVLDRNEPTHRFWTRMGFQPEQWVGPIEQGLKLNRVLRMKKELGG